MKTLHAAFPDWFGRVVTVSMVGSVLLLAVALTAVGISG
jgi:hypothetical protein